MEPSLGAKLLGILSRSRHTSPALRPFQTMPTTTELQAYLRLPPWSLASNSSRQLVVKQPVGRFVKGRRDDCRGCRAALSLEEHFRRRIDSDAFTLLGGVPDTQGEVGAKSGLFDDSFRWSKSWLRRTPIKLALAAVLRCRPIVKLIF